MNPDLNPHLQKKPVTLLEISDAAKKRVAFIAKEFTAGFELIKNYPKSVTFFGSARTEEGDKYYEEARDLAKKIVTELRYSVLTGGGPGIMQAANRGAYEAGGNSIGLTIELPHEQVTNPYITDKSSFHYFFSRKVCLSFSAEAYVFFPGGFGTLDEFTEILTLVQTNKIPKVPIILVGVDYWTPLQDFFKEVILKGGMISKEDLSLYTITDDKDEIVRIIKEAPVRFGLAYNEQSHSRHKEEPDNVVGPLSELSSKHCVPCEGNTEPFSSEQAQKYMKEISEWTLEDEKEIHKDFELKDFTEAMNFMHAIGIIAEQENHHPDIKIHDYKKVNVKISTHAIDGLSPNDFILAAKIDKLFKGKGF